MTNAEMWIVLNEGQDKIAPPEPPSDRQLIELLVWQIVELRSRVDCLYSDEEGIVRG